MDLRINRLEINNFKGIKHQVLELGGKNTLIKGQNGAGKSTCGSALGWIISDTDIELNKNPMVTPLGEPEVVSKVEAELSIDGKPLSIAKIQKYKQKMDDDGRISSQVINTYEINSINKNQKDFVADLEERGINVQDFMVLTNPNQFTADNSKKGREQMREILFEMADEFSDIDISKEVKADEVTALLEEKGYKLDEIEAMAKSQIKKVIEVHGKSNEIIDGRIQGIIDSKSTVDINLLMQQQSELNEQISEICMEESLLNSGNDEIDQQIKALEKTLQDMENQAKAKADAETSKFKAECKALEDDIETLELQKTKENQKANKLRIIIDSDKDSLESYRSYYKSVQDEVLDEKDTCCPTCHREFAAEQIAEIKNNFNASKAKRMQTYKLKGEELKAKIIENENKYDSLMAVINGYDTAIASKRHDLKTLIEASLTGSGEDYKNSEEYKDILVQIDSLNASKTKANDDKIQELSSKKNELQTRIKELDDQIAVYNRNKELDEQIEKLREEKRQGEINKAAAEKTLNQVEQIRICKDDKLAESINSKFSMVNWHFYELQRNGDRKSICEPYIDVKPMNSCANGSLRTLAKISICADIQKYMGVCYPIFVDDYTLFSSNSTAGLKFGDSQLIALVVTEDPELVIEKGE